MTTRTTTVGQFVSNFSALPYIRAQQVKVFLAGLRPSTRHYVYFDRVDVNALCAPATVSTASNVTQNSFIITGERGSTLTTNTKGELSFVFDLPANSFFVGEREIFVCDANLLTSQDAISSSASGKFNAYSYSIESSSLTINTIVPTVTPVAPTSTTTVPSSSTSTVGGFTQSGVSYWESTASAADGTAQGSNPSAGIGPDATAPTSATGLGGQVSVSMDAMTGMTGISVGVADGTAAAGAATAADGGPPGSASVDGPAGPTGW